MPKTTAVIYVRRIGEDVGTADRQIGHLRSIAEQEGYIVKSAWIDAAPIDARRRPALDALRRTVAWGEIDLILIPSLAALGMLVDAMVTFVWQAHRAGIRPIADDIDNGTSDGIGWIAGTLRLHEARERLRHERFL